MTFSMSGVKVVKRFLAIGLFGIFTVTNIPAIGAPVIVDKKFANCTELNKVYPGGVAESSSVRNKGGDTKKPPTVNAKVYSENKTKDRDRDGIACEK